ncbi:MAG: adenylate/guanylate cyclase domain-containing protein [Maribacter sp.]|uniref:adenylate/guanylate cyclase domain-containing protein n=1 Tax=Maribacter sp. TaxID=1897614 RepID=UPI003C76422D
MNTAARLQDAAQPNQILISENCYELVKEAFKCKKIGDITMKNKAQTLTAYEVLE